MPVKLLAAANRLYPNFEKQLQFMQPVMLLPPYDIERIENAKTFIDADMTSHHTIADIASHVGVSAAKLTTGFKKMYGKGLYQYLREQRLDKGKYLLENTWKHLKEISRLLGYKHTCNFNTAFRKKFGQTPHSWRKVFQQ